MSTAPGSVQSIDRTLSILETLSAAPLGLSLSDLAAATDLHISTAHRLVNVLAEHGYALKDPSSGKYRLTLRTFEIGSRVSSVWNLLSSAKPQLDELAAVSQEAVHLVERDGHGIVYLYKAEPFQQLVRMDSHVGLRNPMYCTGVGKSILALLPPKAVKEIWETEAHPVFSPHTIVDFSDMQKELDRIRSRGYAIDDEEHEPGVRCIAAAIRNWAGAPVAAISISAPVSRMDAQAMERLLPRLLETSVQISRMMGFSD
ncbi:IclR family transcriptional regulator [Oscillibacter sp.]|uniref:IclR family transcriptional regulator n=1 Tax=Oscillibacter sp. TaxID=1945593 RepID=UPI00261A12D3|nr:IclR family transcriptional regulator [Oscillibacter sp.]MDD3347660.1 IclR family transcriptional regulator [Oscillibacter sp.]